MPSHPEASTTLRDLLGEAGWVIISCDNTRCGRRIASRIPQFIAKFGEMASSNRVRENAVCTVCHHKGCTTTTPSWGGADVGFSPFPGEGVEVTPSELTRVRKWKPGE